MSQNDFVNSINIHSGSDFPYLVLHGTEGTVYPHTAGFRILHWHEDLQFIYILKGSIALVTLDGSFSLSAGQGVFINKNVVHMVRQSESCRYNSFVFPEHFLKFYFGSPAGAAVESVTQSSALPVIAFRPEIPWQAEILQHLAQLSAMEEDKPEFYAYEVLVQLTSLWLTLRKNITLPPDRSRNLQNERMQQFLEFIAQHYTEDLSLDDLAQSVHVSKSECLRCFKASLNTTPYRYLLEYRLSAAADLLRTTSLPIGEISSRVGFHQVSHFGKCFREKTGFSPKEYRMLQSV